MPILRKSRKEKRAALHRRAATFMKESEDIDMLQSIKDTIHRVCKEEGWEWREAEQAYFYKLYVDRGDCHLDKKHRDEIKESNCPRDVVADTVYSLWDDTGIEMIIDVIDIVKERLNDDGTCVDGDLYWEMREYAEGIMFPEYPFEDYLREMYEVNLVLDTGDQNTDYSENNFAPHYDSHGDRTISKESSLLWLVKQQGRTKKDLMRAFREIDRSGTSEDLLLKSVYQEVQNASSCMNALTFLVRMSLEDILRITEAIAKRDENGFQYDPSKRPNAGEIHIPKTCMCGLVDYWFGAGSVLDIKLEKDVVLPIRYLRSADPDEWERYSVKEIYGMCDSAWRTEVSLHLEEKKGGRKNARVS